MICLPFKVRGRYVEMIGKPPPEGPPVSPGPNNSSNDNDNNNKKKKNDNNDNNNSNKDNNNIITICFARDDSLPTSFPNTWVITLAA